MTPVVAVTPAAIAAKYEYLRDPHTIPLYLFPGNFASQEGTGRVPSLTKVGSTAIGLKQPTQSVVLRTLPLRNYRYSGWLFVSVG